ncbi:MAG: hypothetical protein JWL62_1702, partial [Hyphomicrobiales bacterium]|nr:hypothetical protein [Hyphomicrobiales bacterium]
KRRRLQRLIWVDEICVRGVPVNVNDVASGCSSPKRHAKHKRDHGADDNLSNNDSKNSNIGRYWTLSGDVFQRDRRPQRGRQADAHDAAQFQPVEQWEKIYEAEEATGTQGRNRRIATELRGYDDFWRAQPTLQNSLKTESVKTTNGVMMLFQRRKRQPPITNSFTIWENV